MRKHLLTERERGGSYLNQKRKESFQEGFIPSRQQVDNYSKGFHLFSWCQVCVAVFF